MDKPEENLLNAGLIFMYSVWLQGQMADLVILKKNPNLIADFVANPKEIPAEFLEQRAEYWEKHFGEVKNEFVSSYAGEINDNEIKDIEHLLHVRNMIGHAHVSMGRDFMLYRPSGEKKEKAVLNALKPQPVDNPSKILMLKLQFWKPEVFKDESDRIGRLDQECFARLARGLGVPHSRIR